MSEQVSAEERVPTTSEANRGSSPRTQQPAERTKKKTSVTAKGDYTRLSTKLDPESVAILNHLESWFDHRLDLKVSTSVIIRRALQSLILDIDETERLIRKGTPLERMTATRAESIELKGLGTPFIVQHSVALPKIKIEAVRGMLWHPTFDERQGTRSRWTRKNLQRWLVQSLRTSDAEGLEVLPM